MNMDIYSATPHVAKKRRTYSKEFKLSIVNACKNSNTSIASVVLQHSINANLVNRWIRIFSHHDGAVQDPTHVNPAFMLCLTLLQSANLLMRGSRCVSPCLIRIMIFS